MTSHFKTNSRGANPFAPQAKQRNQALTTPRNGVYEKLEDRVNTMMSDPETNELIKAAIEELRTRLDGKIYQQHHFGYLAEIEAGLVDINIDIQRDLLGKHIGQDIIVPFDPRIMQPISVTYIKSTGRYSAWDGQQSAATLKLLLDAGLIDPSVKIQCKVVDDDLTVPGSALTGEAYGNLGFRLLNTSREPIDAFWMHRSRVSGVRNYGSNLVEDLQAEEIQQIFERNHMFPAKASDAQGQRAKPGMVTHISACNGIAGHGTEAHKFALTKGDLERALAWHNRYFPAEKGVDGGFILAFGRLYCEARDQGINITEDTEKEIYKLFQSTYATPKGFHQECKDRLKKWKLSKGDKESWTDACLTPILVLDFRAKGFKGRLPTVTGMGIYDGI